MPFGRKPSFQPTLECLEERDLLAAHLTASLSGGLLRIEGTAGADTIVVRQVNNHLSVDGVRISIAGHGTAASVSVASVGRIAIYGNRGNDRIFLNSGAVRGQQALKMPIAVWGGAGNDLIVGGAGPESLYGGSGNDTIYAGSGNTLLDGGLGTNTLVGGAGSDRFVSHSRADVIDRGRGHTTINREYPTTPSHSVSSSIRSLEFSSPAPSAAQPESAFAAQVNQIIALENAYRTGRGLSFLTVNGKLMAAAQYQANYMARTGAYSHTNLDGRTLADRAGAADYSFSWVAENILLYNPSIGRTTSVNQYFPPSELAPYFFDGWKASAEHNALLVSAHADQIGVALAQAADGKVYADMVLGHA